MIGFGEALGRLRFGRRFGFRLCFGRRRCWCSRFGRSALRRCGRLRLGYFRRFALLGCLRRRRCFRLVSTFRRLSGFRRSTAFGSRRAFRFFFFCHCFGFAFGVGREAAFGIGFGLGFRHRFGYTAFRCRAAVGRCFVCITSRKGEYHQSCKEDCGHFPFHHHDHLYLHNTEKHAKVQRNRKISRKSYILCAGLSFSSGSSSSDSSRASR